LKPLATNDLAAIASRDPRTSSRRRPRDFADRRESRITTELNETERLLGPTAPRNLLIVTALVETSIGVTLLLSPPFVAGLLLGVSLDAPAALVVGRVAGTALLSLGGACWLARDDGPSRAVRGLIAMLLLYNCAVGAILADAGARLGLVGPLMWPAVAVHVALAVWCIACLWTTRVNAAGPVTPRRVGRAS
jgi:hypothetical protein